MPTWQQGPPTAVGTYVVESYDELDLCDIVDEVDGSIWAYFLASGHREPLDSMSGELQMVEWHYGPIPVRAE